MKNNGLRLLLLCLFATSGFAQVIKGTYAIKNSQTGLVLRVQDAQKSNGAPIVSYSPVNWKCVTWDFRHVDGNTYQLRNLFTSKTLQPTAASPTVGVSLEQQPLTPFQTNQEYEFFPAGKDSYRIRLKGTELYITPTEGAGSVNSKVILTGKTVSTNQIWVIYQQEPTM